MAHEISAERKALIEAVLAGKKLQQWSRGPDGLEHLFWGLIYPDNPMALLAYAASANPEHLRVAPDPVVRFHAVVRWSCGVARTLGARISYEAACKRSNYATGEWSPVEHLAGVMRIEYDPDTYSTKDRLPVVLKAEVLPPPPKETA